MSIMNVVLYPDDPLCQVAKPYESFTPDLAQLAEDMFETMYTYDGVGLAGPQVGLSHRILTLDDRNGTKMCLVNPEILEAEGREEGDEGCLSLPEIFASVPRATRIHVRAHDPSGKQLDFEARDFLARIIQHECDHLEGICFPDRCDILTRQALLTEWDEVRERLAGAAAKRD